MANELLDDNEWTPSFYSKRWIKRGLYYEYEKPPKIEYEITDDLIYQMQQYNKYFNKNRQPENTYEYDSIAIIKIYIIYSDDMDEYYVGYTTRSVLRSLKLILHKYLMGEWTILNYFNDIHNIKFKLVKCLKGPPEKHLLNKYIGTRIKIK